MIFVDTGPWEGWPVLRAFPEENGVDKLGLYLKFFNATEKFRPHEGIQGRDLPC